MATENTENTDPRTSPDFLFPLDPSTRTWAGTERGGGVGNPRVGVGWCVSVFSVFSVAISGLGFRAFRGFRGHSLPAVHPAALRQRASSTGFP